MNALLPKVNHQDIHLDSSASTSKGLYDDQVVYLINLNHKKFLKTANFPFGYCNAARFFGILTYFQYSVG